MSKYKTILQVLFLPRCKYESELLKKYKSGSWGRNTSLVCFFLSLVSEQSKYPCLEKFLVKTNC